MGLKLTWPFTDSRELGHQHFSCPEAEASPKALNIVGCDHPLAARLSSASQVDWSRYPVGAASNLGQIWNLKIRTQHLVLPISMPDCCASFSTWPCVETINSDAIRTKADTTLNRGTKPNQTKYKHVQSAECRRQSAECMYGMYGMYLGWVRSKLQASASASGKTDSWHQLS